MSSKITASQEGFLKQLVEFHKNCCETIDWQQKVLEPFHQGQMGPGEAEWARKLQSYRPVFFEKLLGLHKMRPMYWKHKKGQAGKVDQKLYLEWETNLPFVQQVVNGDLDVWRGVVRDYATFHQNVSIARAYSLHTYDAETVECDIFLHPIDEMIPAKLEYTTKRGHIRYRDFPKTHRIELYESYVYSCLVRVARELFAVLPCETIYLNGLLSTGENHYPVISTIFERQSLKARGTSPSRVIQAQRHFVTHKKRTGFHQINRVYSPCVMNQKVEVGMYE